MTDDPDEQDFSPGSDHSAYSWLIPIGTVVVVAAAVVIGLVWQADMEAADGPPEPPEQIPSGQQLYDRHCAACHGTDGDAPPPRYPPLVETEWVTGDAERPTLVVLHGLRGPIEVRGRTYDEPMPGFGTRLSDPEIARILTYIRTSWGNDASPVEPEDVAEIRDLFPADRGPWTAEELEARAP